MLMCMCERITVAHCACCGEGYSALCACVRGLQCSVCMCERVTVLSVHV